MAKVLVKLINEGLRADGKPFSAIFGTYTVNDKHDYSIGSYKVLSENIASLYFGDELPADARIKNLLTI